MADAWGSCQSDGTVNGRFNVDSVTRTGAGKYRVDFTTPMPTANYSITTSTENTSIKASYFNRTTTGFEIYTTNSSGTTDGGFSFTVNATNATLPATVTQEQIESAINNPGASAWADVNEDGTLTNGLNIASVVRNSPTSANYTITFSTPMPDANYSIVGTAVDEGGQGREFNYANKSATGFTTILRRPSSGAGSPGDFSFTVHATNALPPKGGTGTDAWATVNRTPNNGASVVTSSFNIASVTRPSIGVLEFVFTTPMPTSNYAVQVTIDNEGSTAAYSGSAAAYNKTTTGFSIETRASDNSLGDRAVAVSVNCTNATLPATLTQDMLVMKAGDNMTGDLTLGTDKIELNADGSATFAGNITAGNVTFMLDPEHPEKVLDLKARLQNTQAVLLRIKAALIQPDATANELRNRLLEALDILVDDDE